MSPTFSFADDTLTARADGPLGWITLNNPDRHNAISPAMFAAIGDATDALEADANVRVIIIHGAGERAFASGADIGTLGGEAAALPDGLFRLGESPLPTIAMIQGWCLGGGLMTALVADLRIASTEAQFGIPAGRLGVGYPLHATKRLVEIAGSADASEILLTAARFPADEAARMGLVHHVVDHDHLVTRTSELALAMAVNAPLSARATKLSIAAAVGRATDAEAAQAIRDCWQSDDFAEGRAAFGEGREPRFEGV